ncbi:MAG TPA: hypothetical protein VGA50_08955 [Kiloniellales bacterium]
MLAHLGEAAFAGAQCASDRAGKNRYGCAVAVCRGRQLGPDHPPDRADGLAVAGLAVVDRRFTLEAEGASVYEAAARESCHAGHGISGGCQ